MIIEFFVIKKGENIFLLYSKRCLVIFKGKIKLDVIKFYESLNFIDLIKLI